MKRILIVCGLIFAAPVFLAFCGAFSGGAWGLASGLLIVFVVLVVGGLGKW